MSSLGHPLVAVDCDHQRCQGGEQRRDAHRDSDITVAGQPAGAEDEGSDEESGNQSSRRGDDDDRGPHCLLRRADVGHGSSMGAASFGNAEKKSMAAAFCSTAIIGSVNQQMQAEEREIRSASDFAPTHPGDILLTESLGRWGSVRVVPSPARIGPRCLAVPDREGDRCARPAHQRNGLGSSGYVRVVVRIVVATGLVSRRSD